MPLSIQNFTIPHYESDIVCLEYRGGSAVKKCYRTEEPCIVWLNRVLRDFYPGTESIPVAQHEFAVLTEMARRGISPEPLELGKDFIIMRRGGAVLRSTVKTISAGVYHSQSAQILSQWRDMNFKHNDLGPDNVLWDGERLQIIDFTLSEYAQVRFIDQLPNPNWAKVGMDDELENFLSLRWRWRYQCEAWRWSWNCFKRKCKCVFRFSKRNRRRRDT